MTPDILLEVFTPLILAVVPVFIGLTIGRMRERAHLASLDARETEFAAIELSSARLPPDNARGLELVVGSVALTQDGFQSLIAFFRRIFGGRIKVYESLVERARREAALRMKERAAELGATAILNVRFTTSNIASTSPQNASTSVEVIACGTAIHFK